MERKSNFRQSVSAIFIHNNYIFMVKRDKKMRDFPGYWAFPGGKLEPKENHLTALTREIKEELGFELTSNKVGSIDLLESLSSPDFVPYAFENSFYLIHLKEKEEFKLDIEAEDGGWFKASNLIEFFQKGELLTIDPIYQIIQYFYDNQNLRNFEFDLKNRNNLPSIECLGGIYQFMPKSNTLPPFERTNCFYFKEAALLVDPSPATDEELDKLQNEIERVGEVESILITHHHPDHYERANILARRWDAFILLHRDTHEKIEEKDPTFFNDTFIFFLEEGESLGSYEGGEIIAYNLQGHAKAQICLADTQKRWFLAGDLFQGKGSVVLSSEPRSLSYYLDSLQFVIDYNPEVIMPSHGIPLGGVELLKRLKIHRLKREEQVLNLVKQGHSIDEITMKLYGHFSTLLQKLGRRNIHAHIEKLKEEDRC